MLVNEIKQYTIKLEGHEEEITLRLDFKAMIKMHKEYGNAFLLMNEMIYENNLEALPKIIRCMTDVEITEEEIINHFEVNSKTIDVLADIVNDLIVNEVASDSEFEVKSEIKNE